MESIIYVGSVAGAILSIVALIGGVVGCVKSVSKILKKLGKMEEHLSENYLSTLRLTIMSTEIPLSERVAAGEKYVKMGGNGAVKHYYEKLCEKYASEQEKKELTEV